MSKQETILSAIIVGASCVVVATFVAIKRKFTTTKAASIIQGVALEYCKHYFGDHSANAIVDSLRLVAQYADNPKDFNKLTAEDREKINQFVRAATRFIDHDKQPGVLEIPPMYLDHAIVVKQILTNALKG